MGNLVVRRKSRTLLYSMALLAALSVAPLEASAFQATQVYQPISETQQDKTITLTGRDLTIEQVVDIARHGAKVVVNDLGASPDGTSAAAGPAQEVVEEIRALGGQALVSMRHVVSRMRWISALLPFGPS